MTATLHILRGLHQPTTLPLGEEKYILGRDPTKCNIHIPIGSVSREHAFIKLVNGRYFIEDNKSRNGTFVNNKPISGQQPLENNDEIRICDFLAKFFKGKPGPEEEDVNQAPDSSTIESTLSQGSHLLLDTQPAEKLRTLLEISANLSKTLELDGLLPVICDSLFELFRQADRCFIIQAVEPEKEGDPWKLVPRVVKTRRPQDEQNARFSRSIVRKCLETVESFLSGDAQADASLSQSVVDFRIRSVMSVPLTRADGAPFGVIQLDTQDKSKKFTEEDLKLLWGVAHQASIAMENARLLDEAVTQARLKRDLETAHIIQLSFLPRSVPTVPGYAFGAFYQSAQEVGGDYYGFIPLEDGRVAVALGDVAGKGIPAALLMAKLSSEIRFCLLREHDPAAVVTALNDLLYEFASRADRFVTLNLAVLDPKKHEAILVNAGHPSPLLYRPGSGELVEAVPNDLAGPPVGIADGYRFDSCKISFNPGDTLLVFTDGVTDPENGLGQDFGVEGIRKTIRQLGPASPQTLIDRLVEAVQTHAFGSPQFDDIALVSVGRIS